MAYSRAMVRVALGVLFAWLGLSGRAHAQWRWTAAEGCLDARSARTAVESALGGPVSDELAVEATVGGVSGAWRAAIEVRGRDGVARSREVTSEDEACQRLDDAVVVVSALLIDEARAASPPTPLAIDRPARPSPAPVRARAPSPRWMAIVRTSVIARVGELPGLAGGVALDVEVEPPGAVPLVLSVGVSPPVTELRDGRGGRFFGAFAALGTCPGARLGQSVELGGCAAVSATYLAGEGVGVAVPERADALALLLGAEVFARAHLDGALWVRAGVGALVAVVRPRATIRQQSGDALVHEVAAVVPEGSIGLELHFE